MVQRGLLANHNKVENRETKIKNAKQNTEMTTELVSYLQLGESFGVIESSCTWESASPSTIHEQLGSSAGVSL